jgi:hypothetical protein
LTWFPAPSIIGRLTLLFVAILIADVIYSFLRRLVYRL